RGDPSAGSATTANQRGDVDEEAEQAGGNHGQDRRDDARRRRNRAAARARRSGERGHRFRDQAARLSRSSRGGLGRQCWRAGAGVAYTGRMGYGHDRRGGASGTRRDESAAGMGAVGKRTLTESLHPVQPVQPVQRYTQGGAPASDDGESVQRAAAAGTTGAAPLPHLEQIQ